MGNRHKAIWAAAASVALVGLLTACKSSGGNQVITISGAGSTFINPAMTRWTYEFTQYAERFQWPLGFALLLLVLEGFIEAAPRTRKEGGQ